MFFSNPPFFFQTNKYVVYEINVNSGIRVKKIWQVNKINQFLPCHIFGHSLETIYRLNYLIK